MDPRGIQICNADYSLTRVLHAYSIGIRYVKLQHLHAEDKSMRMIILLCSLIFAFEVSATMAAMYPIPMSKVLDSFKTVEAQRMLTSEEAESYQLARLAESAFKVETVISREPFRKDRFLGSFSIVDSIRNRLRGESNWQTPKSKELISNNRKILEKAFRTESYEWASVLILLEDQTSAKRILNDLFSKEYKRVLNLNHAEYGLGGTPMGDAEHIHKALVPLTSGSEQTEINDKMQKMKIHISKLPQTEIMT